jgi:LuxR family maltose regulon positive regulatory protein
MAALSLRGAPDPARAARALDVRGHAIAEYFISEVLQSQPPEVTQFMLETSVLGRLTAEACAAVTRRPDAAVLLRGIDAANLFLVALDDERSTFRYHHLVRRLLRAELRARDRDHERAVQLRAGEWFEAAGDMRRAARHFLAGQQPERALTLLQDRVVPDFLRDPAQPAPLNLSVVDPALLAAAPDQLLALATDLLLSGDPVRGGQYLDLLERAQPPIPPESALAARYAAMRSFHYAQTGHLEEAVSQALAARAIQERIQVIDDWTVSVTLILLRVYPCLEDYKAVEREAAEALELPGLTEPARLVLVPGARALAWSQSGYLAEAAEAAAAAAAAAGRLGFGQHFFAVDYLRAQAAVALERRDLDTAERLTERTLSITEQRRPLFEFLALLDRASIWAARGQLRDALATVKVARTVLAGTKSVLLAEADELEAQLRLSLGDLASAADLAGGLRGPRRRLLQARIALAGGDHEAAAGHLRSSSLDELTPRRVLERQVLLAAVAIERGDPMTAGIVGGVLHAARHGGFVNTVVTTAPQVTSYLIEHWAHVRPDPLMEQLIAAAMQVRAAQPNGSGPGRALAEPLTAAELRILKLLPTSTYLQMAATLYISRNTVKTHLRSIYQKLGVASRTGAIERAVDLRLI